MALPPKSIVGAPDLHEAVEAAKSIAKTIKPIAKGYAQGGETSDVQYSGKQDGPFYRLGRASGQGSGDDGEVSHVSGGRDPAADGRTEGPPAFGDPGFTADPGQGRLSNVPANNHIRQTADKYVTSKGMPGIIDPDMPRSSLAKQSAIARAFELGAKNTPGYKEAVFAAHQRLMPEVVDAAGAKNYDDLLHASYKRMEKETADQFDALPLKYSFHRNGEGDYPSSREMLHDLHNNKHLFVFQGGEPHEMLNDMDLRTGLTGNEKFRAVHDAFGHGILGNTFGPQGEERAWGVHSHMYSPLARLAMSAETRGQNSFVNYSHINSQLLEHVHEIEAHMAHAMRNKNDDAYAKFAKHKADTLKHWQFAPQKALLLPPEMVHPEYKGEMPEYLRKLERPQHAMSSDLTHYSPKRGLTELDPAKFGTGLRGDEYSRVRGSQNSMKNRTYYYLGDRGEVEPERGVGNNAYSAHSDRLYDISKDPHGFFRIANEANRESHLGNFNPGVVDKGQARSDVERMAYEHGYSGVANPKAQYPMAALFEKLPLRRAHGGMASGGWEDPEGLSGWESDNRSEPEPTPEPAPVRSPVVDRALKHISKYVEEPHNTSFAGVYGNPKKIAAEAASRVAPEEPHMKRLFGVNRHELYDIGEQGKRPGNMEPDLKTKEHASGSKAARRIMTPANAKRLQALLHEAGKHEGLRVGMDSWYVMDPAYKRLEELLGPDEAKKRYARLNAVMAMMSPSSDVETEINRGTAANSLMHHGRVEDFFKYAGLPEGIRGPAFPRDMRSIKGHAYHSTAHSLPLSNYIKAGKVDMQSAKVPLYEQASRVPEIGFQTKLPVPDAHFTRAVGLSNARTAQSTGASMKMPELQTFGPWFRENVAHKMGLQAVPAQARLWGAASGQTGVDSPIGSPKLELLTHHIMRAAQRMGVSPEVARDKILTGEGFARGGLAGGEDDPYAHLMSDNPEAAYGLQPKPDVRIPNPMDLYHGSTRDFSKFSNDYVGKSNGLLYGHGHYLTDDPNTAHIYARHELSSHGRGPIYNVKAHVTPEDFLDWDKAMRDQHSNIQSKMSNHILDHITNTDMLTGRQMHGALLAKAGREDRYDNAKKRVAEMLSASGIHGIRYRGGSSPVNNRKKVTNYVVFDPRHLEIAGKFADGGDVYHGYEPRKARADGGGANDYAPEINQALQSARQITPSGFYSQGADAAANLARPKGTVGQLTGLLRGQGVKGEELKHSGVADMAPGDKTDAQTLHRAFQSRMPDIVEHLHEPRYDDYAMPGGENYRELLLKLNDPSKNYGHPHWPGHKNVLAHLRMKDRVDEEGKKVLHLDELQSDWGQQGREFGFNNGPSAAEIGAAHARVQEARRAAIEHDEETRRIFKEQLLGVGMKPDVATGTARDANINTLATAAGRNKDRAHLWDQANRLEHAHTKLIKTPNIPSAPFVGDTKDWVDLGLKRALTEAARTGADRLAWTPGVEHVKRFGIGNAVKRLEYQLHPIEAHKNILTAYGHEGEHIHNGHVAPEELSGLIGKEAADKLLSTKPLTRHYYPSDKYGSELTDYPSWSQEEAHELGIDHIDSHRYDQVTDYNTYPTHVLEGDGLTMGGEGMKGFYDKIVPSRLMALAKKLDPEAKMGKSWVPRAGRHSVSRDNINQVWRVRDESGNFISKHPDEYGAQQDAKQRNFKELPHLEITPKMREHILTKGLPMYERGGEVQGYAKGGHVVEKALGLTRKHRDAGGQTLEQLLSHNPGRTLSPSVVTPTVEESVGGDSPVTSAPKSVSPSSSPSPASSYAPTAASPPTPATPSVSNPYGSVVTKGFNPAYSGPAPTPPDSPPSGLRQPATPTAAQYADQMPAPANAPVAAAPVSPYGDLGSISGYPNATLGDAMNNPGGLDAPSNYTPAPAAAPSEFGSIDPSSLGDKTVSVQGDPANGVPGMSLGDAMQAAKDNITSANAPTSSNNASQGVPEGMGRGDTSGMAGQSTQGDPGGSVGNVGAGNAGGGSDGPSGPGDGPGEKRGGLVDRALRRARAAGGNMNEHSTDALEQMLQTLRSKQLQGQSRLMASAPGGQEGSDRRSPPVASDTGNIRRSLVTAQAPQVKQDNAATAAQSLANTGQSGEGLGDTVQSMIYGPGTKPSTQPSTKPNTQSAPPAQNTSSPTGRGAVLSGLLGNISNKLESGGNYAALGPVTKSGDRAYGKYQVMGSNIPSWTQQWYGKSLTPQEFLASKEAQEAVAKGQLGSYLDKYGNPQDAASMWFTGKPASQGANLHDQLGTSGSSYVSRATEGLPSMNASTQPQQPQASASNWDHDIPIPGGHAIRNGIVIDQATGQPLTDAQIQKSLPNTQGSQDTHGWYSGDHGPTSAPAQTSQADIPPATMPNAAPATKIDLSQADPTNDNQDISPVKRGGYIRKAYGGLLSHNSSAITKAKRGGSIVDTALALTRRR